MSGVCETRTDAAAGQLRAFLILPWLCLACLRAGSSQAASPGLNESASLTNGPLSQPLSLTDAINLALERNPNILRAKKDLESAQGVTIQTRAIAIPKLALTGSYNAQERSDVDILSLPAGVITNAFPGGNNVSFGNDQNWVSQVKLVQSIYEGGRILSALRAARLTREQSILNFRTTIADTVLAVEAAYGDVLLDREQICVQEASVELLSRELEDTARRYKAGTVPRFNVLRAEVELANARPKLIRARNDYRIAKNNLANLLGLDLPRQTLEDIPLRLTGVLEAQPWKIELPSAIATALERRTELGALRKTQALRQEDVAAAKAGYKPSVQLYAGYDAHNSMLSPDLAVVDHGWIAGAQLSWNIFDGFRAQGRVKETTALFERAGIDLDDTARRIELDVRTAYSNFIEADETLKSQQKVVEEAEEALRLASARSEAGTGTQLDVLSAQTALTEARTTRVQALHDYVLARARLERAVGVNIPTQSPLAQ